MIGKSMLCAAMALTLSACADGGKDAAESGAAAEATKKPAAPAVEAAAPPAGTDPVAAQLADYPLDVCPVSGEKLGSMGAPYDHVHDGRLVRFCCDGCLPAFNADPAKFLAKIDAAGGEG